VGERERESGRIGRWQYNNMIIWRAAPVSAAAAGRFRGSPPRTFEVYQVEEGSGKGTARRVGGGCGAEGPTHIILRPGRRKWEWLGTRLQRDERKRHVTGVRGERDRSPSSI